MAAPRFREGMTNDEFYQAVVAMNADLVALRTEKDQLQQALTALQREKDQAVASLFRTARSRRQNLQPKLTTHNSSLASL